MVKCLDSLLCRFKVPVDLLHRNDSLLVDYDEPLLRPHEARLDHVELQLLESLLEFDDALIRAKARLLIGANAVNRIIGSLEIYKELLRPTLRAVSLNVLEHLFHSLPFLLRACDHDLTDALGYLLNVPGVHHEDAVQLSSASRKLRDDD